jgi:hypothetical protein
MSLLLCCRACGMTLWVAALSLLSDQVAQENKAPMEAQLGSGEITPMEATLGSGEMTPMEAQLGSGEMAPMEGLNAAGELAAPLEAVLAAGAGVPAESMFAAGQDVMAGIVEAMAGDGPPMPGAGINLLEEEREDFIREKMTEPNDAASRGKVPSGGS